MIAKEFRELRRDRRTVAMMIALPVVLLVVFGYAANFRVHDIPTVVVGPGASQAAVTVVVGGDGAGKSTCRKVLAGLLEPGTGAVHRPAKECIGYVPATAGLYPDLTVQENLTFTADAYRMPRSERSRKADQILEQTGLDSARGRLGGQLSGGMQRKLAVGLALLPHPSC